MLYGVPIVSPLEYEERKSRKEYVERFDGHGAELEHHRRLDCHEQGGKEGEEGLPCPGDNRKEHQQEREREHQAFGGKDPVQVVVENGHAEVVQERKAFSLEAVGPVLARESVLVEFALVAGPGFVIVIHVLGDGHKDAFVALDAVACFNLGKRKDRNRDCKDDGHDAESLCGEDSLDPFPEILAQETEENDACDELDSEKRKG